MSGWVGELGWGDGTKLGEDRRTWAVADQLNRALGSISANVAEGYSRGTGRDRAHFCEYALGSAREARDWYFKGRHLLGQTVVHHRLALLTELIRLLLAIIPRERRQVIREGQAEYDATAPEETMASTPSDTLAALLQNIPLPEP